MQRIILVGGFGDSGYLNKALASFCKDNGGIRLMCPEHWYFFSHLAYQKLTLNPKAKLPLFEAPRFVASKEPRLPSDDVAAIMACNVPWNLDQASTMRKTLLLMFSMVTKTSRESWIGLSIKLDFLWSFITWTWEEHVDWFFGVGRRSNLFHDPFH